MGCIPLDEERVALIRNHELKPSDLANAETSIKHHKTAHAYDTNKECIALPGGTSNIIYNVKTRQKEQEFLSLVGTIRNCSGGVTPWGTWLTCEESVLDQNSGVGKSHGFVFEVPANVMGLIKATPLPELGRFSHEAAVVDPNTGIVYSTEDRGDRLFYRFTPREYGHLHIGGQLQAMVIKNRAQFDTRNWQSNNMPIQQWFETKWININAPLSPNDDLPKQSYQKGAALFARGEGIHWGDNELYFCYTNGGGKQLGQIMRYQPSVNEGQATESKQPARIQLFMESHQADFYNFDDNLTVALNGHLIVCEEQYTDEVNNHLRGVTPEGRVYDFARLTARTELAGAYFSPDGQTLFLNVYAPAKTLAITGPWASFLE